MQVLVKKVTNFKMHRPPFLNYGSRAKAGGKVCCLSWMLEHHKLLSSIFPVLDEK